MGMTDAAAALKKGSSAAACGQSGVRLNQYAPRTHLPLECPKDTPN
jgi:hypothetical protein